MRAASFCGVILAAGGSTRMGRDKALLRWPPPIASSPVAADDWFAAPAAVAKGTFLSGQIEVLREFTELIVVVAGNNLEALKPVTYSLGASLVQNPAPERGQFSSLQVGVQEVLSRGRDAAIVALVDRPPAALATVQKVREVFVASDPGEIWAVVPEFGGRHGHPIAIGREMMTEFLRAPATATARDVEHAHQRHVLYVPVEDPRITINVNTPEEYAALKA